MNERSSGPSWLIPKLKRIAVAHARGDRVALIIAEAQPGSGERGVGGTAPGPRILLAETYPLSALPDFRAAMTKHHVRHLIRIAPAARTIARSVQIPKAPTADLLTALELMAEAQLATVPDPHRRGWAIVPLPSARDTAPAVVLGWLGAAPDLILDTPTALAHESWTSELLALTLLLPTAGASAASIDRSSGSIGVATCAPTLRLRSLREDASNSARFDETIREVRASLGTETTLATDGNLSIILSRSARERLADLGPEATQPVWLARYALAAGVAGAALNDELFPAIRPAISLRAEPPPRQMSPIERGMRWISIPKHALAVIAIGLGVALFAPLGLAAARHAILSSRLAATKQGGTDTQLLQKRGDFMDELSRRRWPLTKVLGDLAGAMPIGVQVESITLSPGNPISIRGVAENSDKLKEFTKKLNDTGVFIDAVANSQERATEGITFDITSARVIRPNAEAKGLEDFGAQSLGVRLYGEGYKEVEAAEQAKLKEAEAKRSERGSGRRGEIFDSASSRQPDAEPIPEPLAADKIAKLNRTEAGKEMSLRRKVASRAGLDSEVKKRLTSEVEALRARLAELKGEGK